MKKNKKLVQALVLGAVLLCGICIGAGAAGTSRQITATLEPNLTVTFDGVEQSFFDANGNRVYPIAYNGSTYLPMRGVCEQLAGFTVGWDQATRTASVLSVPTDGVDLLDTQRAYYLTSAGVDRWTRQTMTSDKQTKEVNGYTLTHWLEFYKAGISNNTAMASFNVEGKYDTVTFRYYAEQDVTLQVMGDNESVLFTKELNGGELYQEVTVELLNTNQLSFKFAWEGHGGSAFIYNTRLK